MLEAAMVLPLIILIVLSMLMVMLHEYNQYQAQLTVHRELRSSWEKQSEPIKIQRKKIETSSKIHGAVNLFFQEEREYRSYCLSPAACIRLGELMSFEDREE